jgi:2-succinyl-5-enolpyruvyl-6-hydroxy-3-cyclohexene-1-carboxylate synthase
VLLIGDVALAHDVGGLLAHRRLGLDLTIVLIDNGGGAIFDFLPVAASRRAREGEIYTEHIATPTGLDFAKAAALYGLAHERAGDVFAFRAALERAVEDGPQRRASIVEVRGEREGNVECHRRVWEAVAGAMTP